MPDLTVTSAVDTFMGSADQAAMRTNIGLGLVENTALSTWAGTTNLTTLGTIVTGIWHGTAIDDTYISSAATWNAKEPAIAAGTTAQYWRGDKSWQTLDKTAVGLGNVENTALSTWAGSTSITTLGTISTGTVPVGNIGSLGTGVATALAVNVGSAGAFVVFNGALGTPSSGTVTNLTGTASININGTVGATTPTTGAFTTLSATGAVTFTGQAGLNVNPVLTSSGTVVKVGFLQPPDTGVTANNEMNFFAITGGTVTHANGTIGLERFVRIIPSTIAFTSAGTVTSAYTLAVDGPPNVGSGATLTTKWALGVLAGNTRLGGQLIFLDTGEAALTTSPGISNTTGLLTLSSVGGLNLRPSLTSNGICSIAGTAQDLVLSDSTTTTTWQGAAITGRGGYIQRAAATATMALLSVGTGNNSNYEGAICNGSYGSLTATESGRGTNLLLRTYGGSTWVNNGIIGISTTQTQSETARGSKIVFYTTDTNTTAQRNVANILETGQFTALINIASTSTVTGSIISAGGLGVAGAIYAGSIQDTPIGSTTPASAVVTTLSVTGGITLANNTSLNWKDSGGTARVVGFMFTDGNMYWDSSANGSSSTATLRINGSAMLTLTNTGITSAGTVTGVGGSLTNLTGFSTLNVTPVFANSTTFSQVVTDRSDAHGSGATIGIMGFRGRDSAAGTDTYARFQASCVTNTSGAEEGALKFDVAVAGTLTTMATVGATGMGIAAATSATTALNLPASTTGISTLRVPHGSAPSSPVNGDIWTTTAGLYVRINGATVGPLT